MSRYKIEFIFKIIIYNFYGYILSVDSFLDSTGRLNWLPLLVKSHIVS